MLIKLSLSCSGQGFVRSLSDEQKCWFENSRCDSQTDISGILKYTATILGKYEPGLRIQLKKSKSQYDLVQSLNLKMLQFNLINTVHVMHASE